MKTTSAVLSSIFIAIFIMASGLIIYIVVLGIFYWEPAPAVANPLMSADFEVENVVNEDGEADGQWGHVEITKNELEAISAENLKEFAEEYVKNSPYQWTSITTPDGDGIYFPGTGYEYAEYGMLTSDGRTDILRSTIELEHDKYVFQNAASANEAAGADYVNDLIGIQFTAPEGYRMLTAREYAELDELTSDLLAEDMDYLADTYGESAPDSTYEMMCEAPDGLPNVIVNEETLFDSSITLDQYIEANKSALQELTGMDLTVSGVVENTTIAGKEFKKIHVNNNLFSSIDLYMLQDLYIAKKENQIFFICLTYDESTKNEAAMLLNAFQ